jgi:SAM-dependent methyltransferase
MNFNLYSAYYDLINNQKQYAEESDYIAKLLISHLPNLRLDIIELGCGSGTHAEHLLKHPFINSIQGIELSQEMVTVAKDKYINSFDVLQGDIAELEKISFAKKFDAAISLFHVISYLTKTEEIIACFKAVKKNLKPGGVFIFDVWYTPAVYFQKPETRIRKVEDSKIEVTRIAKSMVQEERNVVGVHFEIFVKDKTTNSIDVFSETHPMRHFSTPEIKLMADLSGFELVESHEFQTMKPPSVNTWGVTYILKKHDK